MYFDILLALQRDLQLYWLNLKQISKIGKHSHTSMYIFRRIRKSFFNRVACHYVTQICIYIYTYTQKFFQVYGNIRKRKVTTSDESQ